MAMTKKDEQREQTYQNIIEAAERLFAEHGIAAVSLRQIGTESGSLNTNVVGYYFGTKEALIDAIYSHRIPDIENVRSQRLAELDETEDGMCLAKLMRITWEPLYQLKDKAGNHSYARFLLSVQRAGLGWTRDVLNRIYPAASEIFSRFEQLMSEMNSLDREFRLQMHVKIMVGSLEYMDKKSLSKVEANQLFEEAIQMACAALLAKSA